MSLPPGQPGAFPSRDGVSTGTQPPQLSHHSPPILTEIEAAIGVVSTMSITDLQAGVLDQKVAPVLIQMANYIRNKGAQGQSIEDSTTTPPTIEGMFQQILHATQNTLAAVNAATTVSVDPLSSTNSGGKFSYTMVASGRYRGSATPTSVFCPQQSATMIAGPL